MISEEKRQGLIDGLEMALDACDKCDSLFDARDMIRYYARLMKEDKFDKIKEELGAFR